MKAALLAATTLSVLGACPVAYAQSSDDDSFSNDDGVVMVTARRRMESVLNVPVIETVLTPETLQNAQITDIHGVTSRVPGLIIGDSVLSIGSQISLRGIGTSALDAGIDQSVSLNIDGQQFSQGLTFRSGLFDLAQAEVLRGPQALFFGKNSPGGVIALTTADPGSEFEAIARYSYEFEAEENRTELILSGPVTDTLGLRLATSYADSEGYFTNTAVATPGLGGMDPADRSYGGSENFIIRGTAVWRPTSNFSARLKLTYTTDETDTPSLLQIVSCPNGTGPSVLGFQNIGGDPACQQDEYVEFVDMDPQYYPGNMLDGSPGLRNGGQQFFDMTQQFQVLELDYDISENILLTSTTTFYSNETDALINGVSAGAAGPSIFADNHFTRRDFTQEVRLESDDPSAALNWMLGAYYQDGRVRNRIYVGGNTALGLPGRLTTGTHDVGIESTSLFGQLRWRPISTLEVAGGARWTSETRGDDATTFGAPVDLPSPEISSDNWSPELTLTYTPTDTLTLFGALKQGFKSGSYSITTPAAGLDNSFGDEEVRGGEVGVKAQLLDRAWNINFATYYYIFEGLQVGVSQPTDESNIPALRTLNAGEATTYGIDFDTQYTPDAIDGLTLNLSVNWNIAEYDTLNGVPCYGGQTIALGCTESLNPNTGRYTAADYSGEPLERAPEWQLNGGFDYERPINDWLSLAFGSSVRYSSEYLAVIGDRDDYYQDAYTKYNAYVTLRGPRDAWELSLIGNNIGDVLRAGYCANSDYQNTTVFTSFAQVTGAADNPSGKIDDVGCVVDSGRQVYLRFAVRPTEFFH